MSTQVGKWLGSVLVRLAHGAVPADGFHAGTSQPPRQDSRRAPVARSRHYAADCGTLVPGKTQFVRGLC